MEMEISSVNKFINVGIFRRNCESLLPLYPRQLQLLRGLSWKKKEAAENYGGHRERFFFIFD